MLSDGQNGNGRALRLRHIPVDPDAPVDTSAPARQLLGVAPSTLLVGAVLVASLLVVLLLPMVLPTITQVTNDSASVNGSGEGAFNFLGVNTILEDIGATPLEEIDQSVLYIGFAVVVIGFVMVAPLGVTALIYILNREVADAKEAPPQPEAGKEFILIRLIGFGTQWAIDVLDSMRSVVRPR
ncbi:MAG: hypothetical protein HC915_03455 [Anaerolineae bacterium]|nr:hypothetical protein [Anaerolineae bacterium]